MKKVLVLILTVHIVFALLAIPAIAESYVVPLPSELAETGESVIGNVIRVSITDLVISVALLFMSVIFGLILRYVVPSMRKWINAHCTNEEKSMIDNVIYQMVLAAEQILGAGMGKKKLIYVKDKLMEKGIDADIDAIEAAVFKMNHQMINGILMSDEYNMEIEHDSGETESGEE